MDILWTSKYAPENFSGLRTNAQITSRLEKLAETKNMPHLILYGPSGGGKRVRVKCLLNKIYGRGVLKINKESYIVKKNSTNIQVRRGVGREYTKIGGIYCMGFNFMDSGRTIWNGVEYGAGWNRTWRKGG